MLPSVVAIVGGTGAEGSGLALRFAKAGLRVIIGSRDAERARAAAERLGAGNIDGKRNEEAAAGAAVVILTVPLAAHAGTLKAIGSAFQPGAILVDATVPLEVAIGGRVSRTVTLWDGSAAQQAARLVPEGVSVVAAFHSLSAESLADVKRSLECDVLICGDNAEAKAAVRALVETIPGARAIDAGPLENARYAETLAALLIALNLRHKVKSSGVRFTGLGSQ